MDIQILIGLLFTISPIFELRAGLPIVIEYVMRNGLSVWPYFLLVLVVNILMIFVIFLFFDFLHDLLMRIKWYRVVVGRILNRIQKRVVKLEDDMDRWGYFALMFFVAIPLPGTGVWMGTMAAWVMGLDRWKSFAAIAAGTVIAGLLVLFISFGIFNGLY
ncbi:small multi-drug export protein [archaeon]|jgi:uncharacterized membrane protein|nr:small multi-drug export protein [archaeon]